MTDRIDPHFRLAGSPQELYGIRGMGVNRAWRISTGRPDVVIAILDSGIRWEQRADCSLVRKIYVNRGELPLPESGPNVDDERFGGYDVNGDGVFNVVDYWQDSRVRDVNGNGWVDPEDLILTFSDGRDDDDNGYVDDISGWDFFENDNDPRDDVNHGHGTNQARYAASESLRAGEPCPGDAQVPMDGDPGTCPNCMIMPLRTGDSFVADVNHYAEAVVYAVDNGVSVVESALGTLNQTRFGQTATDYAYRHGVIVNASAADEASAHHNWPAAYEHTLVHNSIKPPEAPGTFPESYLFLNGCTNFGAYIHTAIPSERCSSQATGLAAGLSGLLVSAAKNAVELGTMTNYIDDRGEQAAYPLSAEEMRQLWRLAADDIDFATPFPHHAFSYALPYLPLGWLAVTPRLYQNYALDASLIETRRYQTGRGWDYFTGYGRINAARLLRYVGFERPGRSGREFPSHGGPLSEGDDPLLRAQDRIPPEADIVSPRWFRQYGHDGDGRLQIPDDPQTPDMIVVRGRAAANRVTHAGGTFDYVLEWAPGPQGDSAPTPFVPAAAGSEERSPGPWFEAARVTDLSEAFEGELGRISVADVMAALQAEKDAFSAEGDPVGPEATERWAVRLRLRVIARPAQRLDRVNNEAVFQKQVSVYPAEELLVRDDLGLGGYPAGGSASPALHDVDGDGRSELLIASDDGLVHAYTDLQAGTELPGWPVRSRPMAQIPESGDNAFTRGDVSAEVLGGFLFGGPAVVDLDGTGALSVLAADQEGYLYAWTADGELRAGFPVNVDFSLSKERPCGPDTIPQCDDLGPQDKRNEQNRRDWAFFAAPAIGDLDPAYPGLEIVAAAADSHIYAWHADGTPVAGWPLLLRDPDKVALVDPETRVFQYAAGSDWAPGSKAITTPSLGDIDNDGFLDVVATVNEQYEELPNANLGGSLIELLLLGADQVGNGRVYALEHTGAATPETAKSLLSAHPHDQAYKLGWPVAIATVGIDLLPTVGQGSTTQPVLADIDGDRRLETVVSTHLGPGHVLRADGSSFYGRSGLGMRILDREAGDFGAASPAEDDPSFPALGGFSIGSMDGGAHLTIAGPCAGIERMLDVVLAGRQVRGEDHLGLWRADSGAYEPIAPLLVNDLQFFTVPVIADVTGDGRAEVVQQTSFGDLNWAGLDTGAEDQVRHPTGGWHINAAVVGKAPLGSSDNGTLHVVGFSRQGYLRVYATGTPDDPEATRIALGEWPRVGHDAHNSGNYHHDVEAGKMSVTEPPPGEPKSSKDPVGSNADRTNPEGSSGDSELE
ncbi:S8 family serine peptidase [Sulfidibacter corallicola]|uniref:Peptidase S8/S53 domain-containing protein n=1 Tax=Sulfidibacter corallicola TaxID=2818388 RepID=A0A8A4TYV2_SULCO|nr:S8 family serine peptidase [Sulfidibacter corallicola]QTD54274.1 hypothetical protein J3U87_17660 [Sulfidibacter corallicola]